MDDHLDEQINILIDGKDVQKNKNQKKQMGQKIGGSSHEYMYITLNLLTSR
jgi:hypothetical protein